MFDFLYNEPQSLLAVGDAMVASETMVEALSATRINLQNVSTCFWGSDDPDEFAHRQLNIERNGPEAEQYATGIDECIEAATVLMTHFNPVPRSLIEKAVNLKLILTNRGGLEHIDVKAATEHGIPVVNVIRNAEPVAEFTLGLMLSVTRNISTSHHSLVCGHWQKEFHNSQFVRTLGTMTVGLAGLGNIGIELARRLKALGVPMIAYEPYLDQARIERNGLEDIEIVSTLEELFERADIVSLHLRLSPETEGIVDKRLLSLMKPSAYFINSARGGLVDYQDLADVLCSHAIAGAALDVFDSEPLSADSPLRKADNLTMTSHIAGQTVDAIPRSPFLVARELTRAIELGNTERIVNASALGLA